MTHSILTFQRLLSAKAAVTFLLLAIILLGIMLLFLIIWGKNLCLTDNDIGAFIVGLTSGTISISGTILLYLTLQSQNEGNKNQKELAKLERFETTFYNLLRIHSEQLNRICFTANIMNNPPLEEIVNINGSSFILFAQSQMAYLKKYFEHCYYVEPYDSSIDWQGYDYKKGEEINQYDEILRIKYVANQYRIKKQLFENEKKEIEDGTKSILQVCYNHFYQRWGRTYDHYIRTTKTIVDYLIASQKEFPDNDTYFNVFRAQFTNKEIRFLNYHAQIDNEFAKTLQGTILEEDL
jgi:hypothetical protein